MHSYHGLKLLFHELRIEWLNIQENEFEQMSQRKSKWPSTLLRVESLAILSNVLSFSSSAFNSRHDNFFPAFSFSHYLSFFLCVIVYRRCFFSLLFSPHASRILANLWHVYCLNVCARGRGGKEWAQGGHMLHFFLFCFLQHWLHAPEETEK